MSNLVRFILAVILSVSAVAAIPSADAKAPRRTALVIGNADYKSSPLANPVNDARAMAKALRKLGFDVIERIDTDQAGMKRAIWDFGKKLREGGVGLFYFAGHGVQVNGENYLIPLKGRIEDAPDLELEAVRVTRVMAEMEKAGNGMNIVILDACRNNPFERSFRSLTRGLAQMSAPYGTLLAYATAPGEVAADGEGANGLYTEELLRAINTPGLRVEDVFKRVRRGVRKRSGGKQVPWESTSIEGDFYFAGPPKKAVATNQPAPVIKLVPPPEVSKDALEYAFWQAVENSKNPADYQAYLDQYPNGTFAGLAKLRIKALTPANPAAPVVATAPSKPAKVDPPAAKKPPEEKKMAALTTGTPGHDVVAMERNFVTVSGATVRSAPDDGGRTLGTIPTATAVVVTGKVKNREWYRLSYRGTRSAFVHGAAISPVGATEIAHWERIHDSNDPDDFREFLEKYPHSAVAPTAREMHQRAEARRSSIVSAEARRTEPQRSQPRQSSPAKQAFRDIWGETRGAWKDAMGFFRSKPAESGGSAGQVNPAPAPIAADPSSSAFAPGSYVRVTPSRLNVRNGPGSEFGVKFSVQGGDSLEVTTQQGSWVRIQTADGQAGWVAGWLVEADASRQASAAPQTVTRAITETAPARANTAVEKKEDPIERLRQLKRLHEQGLISDAEYAAKRQEVLSNL